ncbi:branched-chain amino acid ABC transporter permease [Halorarius halobius]|uniref:branched-chain amino acid ABC transporter permease n=1 Tax=Halorarius halobius TaxID=2962671 RepID=UPI0020CFC6DF|nr:branched-chain amino acid ABC transporter permease [Halorarius halobius]
MTALSTIGWLPLQYSADYLITQVLNGIALGMILVLIAFGLSIIFGLMGVVNFAHGEFLLVGTYTALTVFTVSGSFLAALLVAPLVVAVLGALVERFTLRPIYERDILLQLLLTFGLAEIIREVVMIIWGRTGTSFPTPSWADQTLDFAVFNYPMYRLFVIVVAAVIVVAVYLFLTRTDTGLIIRGATADREMVNALGIDVKQTFLVVFAIGSAIAGVAGALIGPLRSAYPTLGIDLIIPAFVVVVVGGLGSLRGSILAGLLIGELMVLTGVVYSPMSNVIIFVFMALLLLVRPRGLFGREVAE